MNQLAMTPAPSSVSSDVAHSPDYRENEQGVTTAKALGGNGWHVRAHVFLRPRPRPRPRPAYPHTDDLQQAGERHPSRILLRFDRVAVAPEQVEQPFRQWHHYMPSPAPLVGMPKGLVARVGFGVKLVPPRRNSSGASHNAASHWLTSGSNSTSSARPILPSKSWNSGDARRRMPTTAAAAARSPTECTCSRRRGRRASRARTRR